MTDADSQPTDTIEQAPLPAMVGWHLHCVRRDYVLLALPTLILVVISYIFFDERVAWFVVELDSPIKSIANVLTKFAEAKFYYDTIILALVANWVIDKHEETKNVAFAVGLGVLAFLAFFFARLEGNFDIFAAQPLTVLLNALYFFLPLLAVLLLIRKKPTLIPWVFFLLIAIAWSGIIINILKVIFGRFRPNMLAEAREFGFSFFSTGYDNASFPSGHATTAATIAAALWLMWPSKWLLWAILGVTLAFTRIFTSSHYISDVLAGLYLGSLLTLLLHHFMTKHPTIRAALPLSTPAK